MEIRDEVRDVFFSVSLIFVSFSPSRARDDMFLKYSMFRENEIDSSQIILIFMGFIHISPVLSRVKIAEHKKKLSVTYSHLS